MFEEVGKTFGLLVIFDSDYTATAPLQFKISDADYRTALRALESMTNSFIIPVSEKLFMVAKDTTQKRTELEPVMTVVVPFPEPITPQEVQEAARAVQSCFDVPKLGIDNAHHLVLFRDRVSRLRPALELFRQLMLYRGQVETEVELLSYTNNETNAYGIALQTSFPIAIIGNPTPFTLVPSFSNLAQFYPTFGGGKTTFGIGITNTSLIASLSHNQARALIRSDLLALDGQPAQFHVGDKYPILTSGYYGTTTGTGTVYRPPPSVNFEDLGIVLKVTPHVHGQEGVTLEIEAEFKTLTGQTSNEIPVISNRKFVTKVRVGFDETAVVAGAVMETVSQSWSGLPLLVKVPALRMNNKSKDEAQLLLTLTPRLVNLPPTEFPGVPIWVGSETHPLSVLD